MMMIPFMSCSARLPVYVLLISAFFPHYQGLVLISVYVIGVLIAVVVALATKKIMFSKQDIPFVMELPPYRMPTLRNTSVHMWHKGVQYLRKMGTVILFASVLIWALGYFPHDIKFSSDWDKQISTLNSDLSLTDMQRKQQVHRLELAREAERQEKSWIGRMGHFIEPALIPLGFDWKIGVSIITGMAAKEIVIGTMGVLYQTDYSAGDDAGGMKNRMQQQVHTHGELKGQKVFTPLVACTLMLFVLIYFPCIAVIAAIKKEANWKWAVFTMFYTTALAWIVAFVAYQAGSLFV
jgi:ferrous iron transport protein B